MSPADIALVGAAVNGLAWAVVIDRRHGRNTGLRARLAVLAIAEAIAPPVPDGPAPRPRPGTVSRRSPAREGESAGPRVIDPEAKPPARNQYGGFAPKALAETEPTAANGKTGES